MNQATADALRAAADRESVRKEFPEGTPVHAPIPAGRYTDPEFYALEQQHVFRGAWLMAAHESELPAAGDALAISHLPISLILVRDTDDTIRAFPNSCRHRGAALLPDGPCSLNRRIVCPYHSWSYTLSGELAGIAEPREFKNLDRDRLGLPSVRCDVWAGIVFVNLDDTAPDLRAWLGDIHRDLDDEIGDATAFVVRKRSYDVACNWKIAIEANLETYHVNSLHRDTAAGVIDSRTTTSTLLDGGHSRMFLRARNADVGALPLERFPGICDIAGEGILTYSFFPNIALVVSPQLMFTTNAWPIAPNRTRYELYFLGAEPVTDEKQAFWDLLLGFNTQVIEEDIGVFEGMQRSYGDGLIDAVHFGYAERRLQHLHAEIDARIGVAGIPKPLRVR